MFESRGGGRGAVYAAVVVVALAVGGCGRGGEEGQVRRVAETFFSAVQAGDGEAACAELTVDTRSELESQEQSACRDAVTKLQLEGGDVTHTELFLGNAEVDLSSGESAFLQQDAQGWRLSAIGCKPDGSRPDGPFDCEAEA